MKVGMCEFDMSLHNTMPRYRERGSLADRQRRRRHSTSSSPEPYRDRRGSRERRRSYSRGTESRSQERNKHRRRYSRSHERLNRDRSRSPRRQHERRYEDEKRHRSSRREDEYDERRSKRRRTASPHSAPRRLEQGDDKNLASVKGSKALPSQQDAFKGDSAVVGNGTPVVEKQKPNFSATGRLAAESNTIKSSDGQAIVLKYHEPTEARKPPPSQAWRMYVFKGSEIMDTIELNQRSCWLFGREAAVVDFLVEHPSCSKQHGVVQFRYVEKRNEFGDKTGKVKPYLLDLESANGTYMNGEEVPAGRYLELRDKDVLKFGHSTREYVLQLPS
jgi:smad nuclear-interacting protein 1